jgi:predicted anti-sigma-YlaC factor YlaD
MSCTPFREALSARMDGEPAGMPPHELDTHLAGCPSCRNWQAAARVATRRARVTVAAPIPDVTRAVLERLADGVGRPRSRRAWVAPLARTALLVLGIAQLALSLPPLVGGIATMSAPAHVARESGSWGIALAAAFVVVAGSPRLAAGALPVLGSFSVVLASVTIPDLSTGMVPVDRAAGHLLIFAGTVVVAVLAWQGRRGGRDPVGVARWMRRLRADGDHHLRALRAGS